MCEKNMLDDVGLGSAYACDRRMTKRHAPLLRHDVVGRTGTEIRGQLSIRARKWPPIVISVPAGLKGNLARTLYSMRVCYASQILTRDWRKRGAIYDVQAHLNWIHRV